jgi:hypothetical protein
VRFAIVVPAAPGLSVAAIQFDCRPDSTWPSQKSRFAEARWLVPGQSRVLIEARSKCPAVINISPMLGPVPIFNVEFFKVWV